MAFGIFGGDLANAQTGRRIGFDNVAVNRKLKHLLHQFKQISGSVNRAALFDAVDNVGNIEFSKTLSISNSTLADAIMVRLADREP